MSSHKAHINHLDLLVRRMLDAELLLEEDGAALLSETEAICRALEAGDTKTIRRHIEQIAHSMESLIEANALALTGGQAVLQIANQILNPMTDAGDATR